MRILNVSAPESINPYPMEIYDHMVKNHGVHYESSIAKFFLPDEYDFDIIHIHWVDGLASKLLNKNFLIATDNFMPELYIISEVLKKWHKKSKIVYTRHNEKPHEGSNEFYELINDLVYQYANAIIHLGEYSLKKHTAKSKRTDQINVVIPHHMYECYENNTTRNESRSKLGLSQKVFVLLVFGAVRNEQERDFILQVFKGVHTNNKILLAPRWYHEDYSKKGRLYNMIMTRLDKFKSIFRSRRYKLKDFRRAIRNPEVQHYFHSADLVIIPRINTLNSGVLPLAMSYNKPVIGPRIGNITEILENSGNHSFEANDPKGASAKINSLIDQKTLHAGSSNSFEYGSKNFSLSIVSKAHLDLFRKLTSRKEDPVPQ